MYKAIIMASQTKLSCRDSNFEWHRPCFRRKNCPIGTIQTKTTTIVILWSLKTSAIPLLLYKRYIHKLTKIIKYRDNSSYKMGEYPQMFLRNILLS